MTKDPVELSHARIKRVQDAVQLKIPDRIPFMPSFASFSAKYTGISGQEYIYDFDKILVANKKAIIDFCPDMYSNKPVYAMGPLLDILGCKRLKWPGHGVSRDSSIQYDEKEFMPPEEYDDFLFDPTGYILKTYLPRVYSSLESFRYLPSSTPAGYFEVLGTTAILGTPKVSKTLETLLQAGAEVQSKLPKAAEFEREMEGLGFHCPTVSGTVSPFDYIGDFFRGTHGILMDIYRRPDKLLEAVEKATPIVIGEAITDHAKAATKKKGVGMVFIALHKGCDSFMSLEHFETFYWPSLKKLLVAIIDEGLTPLVLVEGDFTSRLEIIGDIPAGKVIYWFEKSDIFKAKEILGDIACIKGNVPASLLCMGGAQEVKDYCRKLIDVVGKGGGFILDASTVLPFEAKPENVRAMVDSIMEFGVY